MGNCWEIIARVFFSTFITFDRPIIVEVHRRRERNCVRVRIFDYFACIELDVYLIIGEYYWPPRRLETRRLARVK